MDSNKQQSDRQSGGQQMFTAGDYDTGNISSWVKGIRDPQILSHLAREVFGEISNLPETDRRQVFTTLKNDVKFQNVVGELSPQTA